MQIIFILVEPEVPENIGAAARAIKTMGFSRLRLVNPIRFPAEEAAWVAHGSIDILDNCEVFTEFNKSIFDLDFLIGTSAKRRSVKFDYYPISNLVQILSEKEKLIKKVGILFGKEESGLSNEQIQQCDLVTYIPMTQAYPSLNLAQAVMIYAYELSGLNLKSQKQGANLLDEKTYKIFKEKLETGLRKLEIDQNPNLFNRIMERSAVLCEDDIHLLLSIMNKMS
jgi:tRNA/rRNA methyltransferase